MKMRWGFFVTTICLICVCYGQKYDISGAVTLKASPHSSTSCGACTIDIHYFGLQWFHQAYTHVAATVVKVVNNATNATITSTIQGSSFTLPSSTRIASEIVPNSVITTIFGGVEYTLTYPSSYMGVGGIESYSQTPITNANGTVKCVVSKAAMTRAFLLRKYISNGLELTPYEDKRCVIQGASPPRILVRVSSLTATTTNYVDRPEARTSSAKKALPSNSLSASTAPQTESSRPDNRPTTTVLASSPPRKTADLPLITPSFTSSEPVHSGILGLVPSATRLIATGDREAEPAPSEPIHVDSDSLESVQPAATLIATGDREVETVPSKPIHSVPLGPVPPAATLIVTKNREAEPAPSEPIHVHSDSLGSVPPAATLIATKNREAETVPSKPIHSGPLGPVPPAATLIATKNREAETVPSQPIHSGSLGPAPPAITFKASGDRDAEPPTKTRTPDQPQELGNVNPASRPGGEPTPTVPLSQPPPIRTRPAFGTTEAVALSSDSSLPIGLSSIVNPTDSFPPISEGRIRLVDTDPTSRPTSLLPPLPSIQTFTNPQEFTVPNPSHFFLSGTTEIHRGGSTIITSGTRSISLGNSATIIIVDDDSSTATTTPLAVHTTVVGTPLSKVPTTTQVITTNYTVALPPAATTAAAAGNRSEVFAGGGQTKLAEVPMLIMFGATLFGIAAPWGLLYAYV